MTDAERIAAFLTAKGATSVPAGVAYGVDPEADRKARKAKRLATRQTRIDDDAEWRDEEYRERVNDAYMSGGIAARDEEMAVGKRGKRHDEDGEAYTGPAYDHVVSRTVKLNRY